MIQYMVLETMELAAGDCLDRKIPLICIVTVAVLEDIIIAHLSKQWR